jgi:hypothetical protein
LVMSLPLLRWFERSIASRMEIDLG